MGKTSTYMYIKMRKIPTFQLRIFVVSSLCLLALPRAKDDSMGRMPLRAPKVLQLSRNPRTWKSLGVILLRLHVFTVHICFFLNTSCHVYIIYICLTDVLHMSSGVLLCYVSVEKYIPNEKHSSSRWWSRFSFWCLAPFSAQHGGIVSWIFYSMDDSPQTGGRIGHFTG